MSFPKTISERFPAALHREADQGGFDVMAGYQGSAHPSLAGRDRQLKHNRRLAGIADRHDPPVEKRGT
jgi:hypothetical protein